VIFFMQLNLTSFPRWVFVMGGRQKVGKRCDSTDLLSLSLSPPFPAEVGTFMHACEGEAVCKLTNAKVRVETTQPLP
jgi:hypothetical protein